MKKLSTGKAVFFAFCAAVIISTYLIGCPQYRVYKRQKDGEAELAHANAQREIAVAEARAKEEAAARLAGADTIRAHGISRANEIIGNSLKNNKAYLQWLWIEQLEKANVIYVPTEANLPLLEAGHRRSKHIISDTAVDINY